MALNAEQLDEHCNNPRARKVAKRSLHRKMRQNIKSALRKGIDHLTDAADSLRQPRGNKYNGWAS